MSACLFRLLALVAIMLMPLGMTGAAATAAPAPGAEHCAGHEQQPEQAPAAEMENGCLACVGLPAVPDLLAAEAEIPRAARTTPAAQPFRGIEPAIATPPPKRA